jgi:hypothetical protein
VGEHHNNKGLAGEQGTTTLRASAAPCHPQDGIDRSRAHRARRRSRHQVDCAAPMTALGSCCTQGQTVFKKKWRICEPEQGAVMKELLVAATTSSAAIPARSISGFVQQL